MANLDLSATLELIDRISAPLQSIQGQADRAVSAFNRARDAVRNLERQQGQINSFNQLNQQLAQNSQRLQQAQQRLQSIRQAMDAVGAPTQQMITRMQSAQRTVDRLTTTTHNQSTRLNQLQTQLQQAGINTSDLSNEQQRLARQITQATISMERQRTAMAAVRRAQEQWHQQQARWQNIGTNATMVAGASALAMSVPIKAFAEAETAATNLKVSMMDATGNVAPEFQKINALAEKLGATLPGSTAEFSDMMSKLVQQGISFKDILGGVGEASANLAVVMKMPFAQAAEFAAKMQDATKTQASDMVALMDTIQKSYYMGVDSTNMLSGFSKISDGMKTIKMEGLAGAKAMAPLLVMADQASMQGESAGNAYSKIFKAMMATDKIAKSLKGTGIQMNFTDGKGEFGGLDNMFKQLEKLKGMSTEKRLPILSDMFGNDAETIQALNLLIDKGKAGYDQTMTKMQAQADLQKRVNAQLGTMANLWDAAKGTFTSAMVSFGEALAPDIKNVIGFITEITQSIGDWAKQNPVMAQTLMRIAAVVVVAAVALAGLSAVMLTVLGPIALLRTAFATLSGGATVFSSLMTVGRGIVTFFSFIGQAVVSAVTLIGSSLMRIVTVVRTVGMFMMANPIFIAIALLATAAYLIYKNWAPIKEFFINMWNAGSVALSNFVASVSAKWASLTASVINYANSLWSGLGIRFSGGVSALLGIIAAFSPVGLFIRAFAAVFSYFAGLGSQFAAYGGHMIDGLRNGIMSRINGVVSSIQSAASRIKSAFAGMMGIHSPSRVFMDYGDNIMAGLNNGLLANNAPIQSMIRTSDNLRSAIDTSQIKFDTRKPITASMANGGYANAQAAAPITIIVNAAPTQSPADIAQLVAQELAKAKLGQTTNNTALYDLPQAWT